MKYDTGPATGTTNLGIYQLSGDTWKVCLATRGTVRPPRFAAPPDSGFVLETLTRAAAPHTRNVRRGSKAREASPAVAVKASASSTASNPIFEGDWSMISGTMNGRPMENSLLQWVRRETRGNRTTVYAGPNIMLKVDFSADGSESPPAINYVNFAGAHKGKQQAGIYKLESDLLTVCVAAPGAARQKEFESRPGDQRSLTV
jgi:uncharacterized protein (TIGR03067 family)